jgi:hypothetical protein
MVYRSKSRIQVTKNRIKRAALYAKMRGKKAASYVEQVQEAMKRYRVPDSHFKEVLDNLKKLIGMSSTGKKKTSKQLAKRPKKHGVPAGLQEMRVGGHGKEILPREKDPVKLFIEKVKIKMAKWAARGKPINAEIVEYDMRALNHVNRIKQEIASMFESLLKYNDGKHPKTVAKITGMIEGRVRLADEITGVRFGRNVAYPRKHRDTPKRRKSRKQPLLPPTDKELRKQLIASGYRGPDPDAEVAKMREIWNKKAPAGGILKKIAKKKS